MERNCGNCDHVGNYGTLTIDGGRHEPGGMLVCRRYPPSVGTHQTFEQSPLSLTSMWPRVIAEDRCGEFTPRVETPTNES